MNGKEGQSLEDDKIITLYWERKEEAIVCTADRYEGYCHTIAKRILNNDEDANECVNDTWLRAWHAIPPKRPGRLSLFLGKITRNLAFDRYKSDHAQKRGGGEMALILDELEGCVSSTASVEQTVMAKGLEQSINQFMYTLSKQACTIFLYRYWYNYTIQEIAERLLMRENSVKASLFRSRSKLKVYLQKEGMFDEG